MLYNINYSLRKCIIEIQVLNLKDVRRCFFHLHCNLDQVLRKIQSSFQKQLKLTKTSFSKGN